MAVGNTFGATALSSYGGFWIAFAIILTPGGFEIEDNLLKLGEFYDSMGLFLMVSRVRPAAETPWHVADNHQGWFIFTTILLICTLKSTVAFCSIFFWLDLAFLLLGVGYLQRSGGKPNHGCLMAGGLFGLLSAFSAWYNAFAGIADSSNSFFIAPVIHFPWSETGKKRKTERQTV